MCNVIPVKCKRVSTHTLMFWAGLGNVIFSFLCIPLPKIDLVTLFHPDQLGKCNDSCSYIIQYFKHVLFYHNFSKYARSINTTFYFIEIIQWIIVIVLGFLAVVINQLLIWANILASPTVNSMVRITKHTNTHTHYAYTICANDIT